MWFAPVGLLVAGVGVALAAQRRRVVVAAALTDAEQARLTEILHL